MREHVNKVGFVRIGMTKEWVNITKLGDLRQKWFVKRWWITCGVCIEARKWECQCSKYCNLFREDGWFERWELEKGNGKKRERSYRFGNNLAKVRISHKIHNQQMMNHRAKEGGAVRGNRYSLELKMKAETQGFICLRSWIFSQTSGADIFWLRCRFSPTATRRSKRVRVKSEWVWETHVLDRSWLDDHVEKHSRGKYMENYGQSRDVNSGR